MYNKIFLNKYIDELNSRGKVDMANSILKTATKFAETNLSSFSFAEHSVGLLFGNVQAGKTAQMFGIICVAADSSFPIFIILTTDNVALYKQTYNRVVADLSCCNFCICKETDRQMFVDNALSRPAIIVLKKNSKVLLQWCNVLRSSSFVTGNAIFIIDDEADAASPNTLVNRGRLSTINSRLMAIQNTSISSIYLQVTGTPQALLLQSSASDFKPLFTCYFSPGEKYLGGKFFFENTNKCIRFIDSYTDGFRDGLYNALIHHLISSAQLLLSKEKVCNFVIHPGVRKSLHQKVQSEIKDKLNYISNNIYNKEIIADLNEEYRNSFPSTHTNHSFEEVLGKIQQLIVNKKIKILLMNGDTDTSAEQYNTGTNIIIGGNILGRGVTFPKLQTLYYTRIAKKPQADTMWQHSRMFGYDRDPGLMAVYITKQLYKLFSNINAGNESIVRQIENGIDKIQLFYPNGLNPTRKNVIDLKMVDLITGGTNYYPSNPKNDSVATISELLKQFNASGHHQVSAQMLITILNHIKSSDDFNVTTFINIIKARLLKCPSEQSILIVRRGREITQGTGSLLSPNDRDLGAQFNNKIVLTMYQIAGNYGWEQNNIWVPNIKLPDFINYYDVH